MRLFVRLVRRLADPRGVARAEQRRESAGVEEDRWLVRGQSPGATIGDEPGHGLAGVHRVEHETLGTSGELDRFARLRGARAVGLADLAAIEREAARRHRSMHA